MGINSTLALNLLGMEPPQKVTYKLYVRLFSVSIPARFFAKVSFGS